MGTILIWPKSENIKHINYHYTQFGEILDYLQKFVNSNIKAFDLDVENINFDIFNKENKITKVIMNVNYENAKNSFNLAEKIKSINNDIDIMAYGNVPKMHPKLFENSKFDVIYKSGDFEKAIENFILYYDKTLINNLELLIKDENTLKSTNLSKLQGLYLIVKNKFYFLKFNDEYIKPNEWGVTNKYYSELYDKVKNKNRFVINISRGCPFNCEHCLIQLTEGKKERRRSIDNLKDAIRMVYNDFKHIKIWAANFTLNENYVNEMCEMILKNFPNLTWECATRLDLLKNEELIKKMFLAGCKQVSLGIESLQNKELIKTKDFTESEIESKIKLLQRNNIKVKGCIMLGMKNQTTEDIFKTFDFLTKNDVNIRPTIYTPYQEIDEDISIDELSNYNRKTFVSNSIEGLTDEDLIALTLKPIEYKKIIRRFAEGLEKEGQMLEL